MKVHHQGNKTFKLTQLYLFPALTNRLHFGSNMYFVVMIQLILLLLVKSFDLSFLEHQMFYEFLNYLKCIVFIYAILPASVLVYLFIFGIN